MIQLPEAFLKRMEQMLGREYPAFLESYEQPRQLGLRANTLKISPEEFPGTVPFDVSPIPWIPNGFFYGEESRPARHPYYAAGLYYLQEPSAMTPASLLDICPQDRVLDLCAAPGGKATELGARLKGRGILAANDISNARAKALLRNLELFGITNAFVLNDVPAKLASYFPGYFNKILVDAPCSGEGMFRKEPAVAKAWTPDRPAYFAKLQREIIPAAVEMLSPGGLMLYSTCTFAPEENEGTISWLLEEYPQMHLLSPGTGKGSAFAAYGDGSYPGFSKGVPQWGSGIRELEKCIRIWPHRMDGEGHFLALLQKDGEDPGPSLPETSCSLSRADRKVMETFFRDVTVELDWSRVEVRAQKAYLLPSPSPAVRGPRFIRNGLFLGELKKGRFEPSQPFAMSLNSREYASAICLSPDDERIPRFLRGETLIIEEGEAPRPEGYQLVCAGRYPLGWGKLVRGVLKNKYPAGWRVQ